MVDPYYVAYRFCIRDSMRNYGIVTTTDRLGTCITITILPKL